jgi:tetratricopeptide (TPR) repeat protein
MNKYLPVLIIFVFAVLSACDNAKIKDHTSDNVNSDSLSILTSLITKDSMNAQLFADRAALYMSRGKIDPAFRDIQSALKITPKNPQLFILLSDIYSVLGQTDNSIASLKKAIRLDPKNEIPFLKLSEVYLMLNDPATAINYTDEAISVNRHNPEPYYVKAICLLENRDTLEAITNLRISANLDSTNYMTFMQLGAIFTSMNDTVSRIYFQKALDNKPDDERALYYLGMYYQEHDQPSEAIKMYDKITKLYPNNKRAFYNIGYLYLVEFEDYENAKGMFEQAIALSPGYVEAVYNLGRTREAMGDYSGAREQYWKSLELLPNYPLAVQSLNRLDDIQIRNKK